MSACAKTPRQQSTRVPLWHIKAEVVRVKSKALSYLLMCVGKGIDSSSAELAVIRLHHQKSLPLKRIPAEKLKSVLGSGMLQPWVSRLGLPLPELCQSFRWGFWDQPYGQALR